MSSAERFPARPEGGGSTTKTPSGAAGPCPQGRSDPSGNGHAANPRPGGAVSEIVAQDPSFLEALDTALRVADSLATVLVCGETGTGKEMVARAIHEYSARSKGRFVAVNCAAIPGSLLESELFGHERGSFTGADRQRTGRFERASGGTLFLDEVGDMDPTLQAKILRALEANEIERVGGDEPIPVDVRLVAASNRCLRTAMAAGEFREDLYYRLAGVVVHLPPLRERPEDTVLLLRHYLTQYAGYYDIQIAFDLAPGPCAQRCETCWLSEEACQVLREYSWPGNIRELRNVAERAALLARDEKIDPKHLPPVLVHPDASEHPDSQNDRPVTLRENERRHIQRVLEQTSGNRSRAAELLGVHRNTLRSKMREHGLM